MAQQSPFIEVSSEFQPELTDIQRKQRLAQLLMERGMQTPQGQMVSGHYVAPSWSQNLANLFSIYSGKNLEQETEKRQEALARAIRETGAKDISEALQLIKGTPSQTIYGAGEEGPTKTEVPAVAGNREAAIARLLKSNSPMAGPLVGKLIEQQFREPKWEKAELTDPKTGNTRQGWVDINSPNPEATFRQGGEKPAIGPMDVMKGRFEGWYTGAAPTGGAMPTGGSSGVMPSVGGGMPATSGSTANFSGLPPQAAIQANKEITVDKLKRQQEYAEKAPAAIEQMGQTIRNINDLIGDTKVENGKVVYGKQKPHPGFESAVGISAAPLSGFIPGTNTTDFKERFNQIKGQSFLQAFETLKGGGQITEIEGAKATAALNRMNLAQSEAEFIKAAREFEENVSKGMELARKRAGIASPQQGGWRIK